MATVDLNELEMLDDLDIETEGPETYADPTGPAPIPAGRYTFRLLDWDFDRDKEGNIRKPKTPTVMLTIEVADGPYQGRKTRFVRVYSTPYKRGEKMVSALGDLLRAFDATVELKGKEKFEALSRYQAEAKTFDARVNWRAFDSTHYKALLGGSTDKNLKRQAGDASTVRGMNKFPQRANGTYEPTVIGPSGEELKAELDITEYIAAK